MSGEDPRLLAAERAIAGLKARITEMEAAFRDAGSGWSGPPKPLKARVRAIRSQRTLGPHPGKVASLAWATAPHLCASACQEGRLIVWDTLRGVDVVNVDLRRQWVRSVALDFQPEPLVAAVGGVDNLCVIHEIATGASLRELSSHDSYVTSVAFVGSVDRALTSSGDATCILWDVEGGNPITHFNDHHGDVASVSVCPNNPNVFVSGSADSTAKVWDIRLGKSVASYGEHESDVTSVTFGRGSDTVFSSSCDDAACRLFDIRCPMGLLTLRSPTVVCGVSSIDFSSSNRLLFAGYHNNDVLMWDTLAGGGDDALIGTLGSMWPGGSTPVPPPAPKSSSVLPITSSDLEIGKPCHSDRVTAVRVNASGHALATGSWDGTVLIWA